MSEPATNALQALLTNGRYSVTINGAGSGYSACGNLALTRWSADLTEDAEGFFIYVRDLTAGNLWSAGYQPVCRPADGYEVSRLAGHVVISRRDGDIETRMEVRVDPDADVEIRRVTLHNHSGELRRIELTSYAEVVLNDRRADLSHPAFSKLFVQTEFVAEPRALLARRRPRSNSERWPVMVHAIVEDGPLEVETDRARFIGRGRTLACPAALDDSASLSGTTGNVLDPIMSLRRGLELPPGGERVTTFLLGAATGGDEALAVLRDFRQPATHAPAFAQPARSEELPQTAADFPSFRRRPVPACGKPGPQSGEQGQPVDAGSRRHGDPGARPEFPPQERLQFFNGYGGFTPDGREYVLRLARGGAHLRLPPLPWINVIANEHFGFIVSETGAGHTWSRNSRLNRLTPWYNDPVIDPHGEALYLRDEESRGFWSPLPGPVGAASGYEVRHGFGYSRWQQHSRGLEHAVCQFVPRMDPLRITQLRLTNRGAHARRLSLHAYFRLVLGESIEDSARHVFTEYDNKARALLACNPRHSEFADGIVFATMIVPAVAGPIHYTADRTNFIGRHRDPSSPAALEAGAPLDGRAGAGLDPCLALQAHIEVPAGATVECAVLFGEARSRDQVQALIDRYRQAGAVERALSEVQAFWRQTLSAVRVETPAPAIDVMVNGWLLYQTLSCRLWGRSACYQSGGAFGFRDQLQDSAALIYTRPDLTRRQILLNAAHQFIEGDVLHWWHPPASRGLRTRFSDDLLWLPYVTSFYVLSSGDAAILDEDIRYLRARPLACGEDEVYLLPEDSGEHGSLYEHCCRSLDRSLAVGGHGLPLMGTGDWNDAMNRVGREGRGESVWVGFFLYAILTDFIPLCEQRGEGGRAQRYREHRRHLEEALNAAGWDGAWYRRAWYDDGTPLGSAGVEECRIDALAQAWAVISGAAPRERAEMAIDAVGRQLVSEVDGIIRLLTPAFDHTSRDPGYIKGYVPGIRENGGQYTHAALWVVWALAELGRGDRAAALLAMLSPISHARTAAQAGVYKLEPYVVAADVYGVAPHIGRGGWSWYTGASGWMYRVALESVLGITLRGGDTLALKPCVPAAWREYKIYYRLADGGTTYEITVSNPPGNPQNIVAAALDGATVSIQDGAALIPLRSDGASHQVLIGLG